MREKCLEILEIFPFNFQCKNFSINFEDLQGFLCL